MTSTASDSNYICNFIDWQAVLDSDKPSFLHDGNTALLTRCAVNTTHISHQYVNLVCFISPPTIRGDENRGPTHLLFSAMASKRHHPCDKGVTCLWTLFLGRVSGSIFTKRTDVLPQDFVKSRSQEILVSIFSIVPKCNRHLGTVLPRCLSNYRALWPL